ncbi:putative metal-binding motif-containing protein [Candidatus Woesearchaeota archaeon]|nr:putative metal-binding motif-containing protein [Candidatus Woesearchaeota archaeon]
MAKNEVKSSSKNNISSQHKNIFIICAAIVIVLLVALWIFSIKEKLPTTPAQVIPQEGVAQQPILTTPEAGEETEGVGLAGKAISGILEQANIISASSLSSGSAAINPPSGVVVIDSATNQGEPFTVDVVAKGSVNGASEDNCQLYRSTHFEVTISYSASAFTFNSAKVILPGTWTINIEDTNQNTKKIVAETSSFDNAFCYLTYTELLELSFTPNPNYYPPSSVVQGNIDLSSVVIANDKGENSGTLQVINSYSNTALTFKKRYYLDNDEDAYAGESSQLYATIDQKPVNYIATKGDCDDNDNTINPIATEVCDGVDNNCAGGIDEEVIPNVDSVCNDKECGVYYDCENTRAYDCNNKVDITGTYDPAQISFKSNDEKCNSVALGDICVNGQCTVPAQAQDCTTINSKLLQCDIDLAICNNDKETCGTSLQECLIEQGACIFWSTDFAATKEELLGAFTPACGDGTCQDFEHFITCLDDCPKPAQTMCAQSPCVPPIDTDGDGLSDTYEDTKIPFFDVNKEDTDGDGVKDNKDYCPNTNTEGGLLTIKTGHVNFNGCYAGDVGQQNANKKSPDGCFSSKDTTFLINYYTSIVKGETCTNLFGETIK